MKKKLSKQRMEDRKLGVLSTFVGLIQTMDASSKESYSRTDLARLLYLANSGLLDEMLNMTEEERQRADEFLSNLLADLDTYE